MNRTTTALALLSLALLCGVVSQPLAASPAASDDDAKKREEEARARAAEEKAKQAEIEAARQRAEALARLAALQRNGAPAPRLAPAGTPLPDGYEMIVYATHRPIRFTVTVRYEGKTVSERWRDMLRKSFDYFDRDGDGFLNAAEAKLIFADSALAQMMANGFYAPNANDPPTLEKLDTDGDGKVSFGEFLAYYKSSSAQVLRAVPAFAENPANAQATEALFKLFDRNGDGKLTKDEVLSVEKLIPTKDADEDECLSLAELVPNLAFDQRGRQFAVQPLPLNGPQPVNVPQNVVIYDMGRIPGTVTQRLLKEYDKDGDFELTQKESGFDDATFRRLDVDGDGKLSGEELDAWRTGPADMDITLSLAPKATDCKVEIPMEAKDAEARGFSVRRVETGRAVVRSARQSVEFWAYAPVLGGRQTIKQQFSGLFQVAAGAKGYVVDKDLTGPSAPSFQLIRVMFDPADANGDGKLTKEEFDAFLELQQSFIDLGINVSPAVQTPTLFQLLDENRDGRLSVRELRTAWDRLLALEEPGATVVSKSVIQPIVSLRLTRVIDRQFVNQPVFTNPNGNAPVPQKGPMWFRKMDRNGDGDVSRLEFLGTKEEFDAIDADHDGLISLQEAEAHNAKMRGEKREK